MTAYTRFSFFHSRIYLHLARCLQCEKSSLRFGTPSSPSLIFQLAVRAYGARCILHSLPLLILVPVSRSRCRYAGKIKTTNFEVNIQDRTYIGKVLWNRTWNSPHSTRCRIMFRIFIKNLPTRMLLRSHSYCKSKHHMLPTRRPAILCIWNID